MMRKNEIIFKEETCKSALTRLKRKMPYKEEDALQMGSKYL